MRQIKVIGWLVVLTLLLFILTAVYTSPLIPSIPELQFTYSKHAFKAVLAHWQASGLTRFKAHFLIDFPFLVAYGLLGFLLSTRTSLLWFFSQRVKSLLIWMLPAAALADAVENFFHLYLIDVESAASWVYLAAGLVATMKWVLILVFVGCAGFSLQMRLWKR